MNTHTSMYIYTYARFSRFHDAVFGVQANRTGRQHVFRNNYRARVIVFRVSVREEFVCFYFEISFSERDKRQKDITASKLFLQRKYQWKNDESVSVNNVYVCTKREHSRETISSSNGYVKNAYYDDIGNILRVYICIYVRARPKTTKTKKKQNKYKTRRTKKEMATRISTTHRFRWGNRFCIFLSERRV